MLLPAMKSMNAQKAVIRMLKAGGGGNPRSSALAPLVKVEQVKWGPESVLRAPVE